VAISLASGLVTTAVSLAVVLLFLAASGSRLDRWIRRAGLAAAVDAPCRAAFGLAFLIAPSGLMARWSRRH
jgi:putative thiamine transport system permease protein